MSKELSPDALFELLRNSTAPLSQDVQRVMDLVTRYRAVRSESPAPEQDAYRAVLVAVLRLKDPSWPQVRDVEGDLEGVAQDIFNACSQSKKPWTRLSAEEQKVWRDGTSRFTWKGTAQAHQAHQAQHRMPAIAAEILAEVDRATVKFPTWPTDPLHALAVLGEEFGELTKAMLQFTYEPHKTNRQEIRAEAIQTAAMALRVAMSLGLYDYAPSLQHKQGGTP